MEYDIENMLILELNDPKLMNIENITTHKFWLANTWYQAHLLMLGHTIF